MLSPTDGTALLTLAREAIRTYLTKQPLNLHLYEQYAAKQAVIVELSIHEQLRGKAGDFTPSQSLHKAVVTAARNAAFNDPTHLSLKDTEFAQVGICLMVFSPPEPVVLKPDEHYGMHLDLTTHGLIITHPLGTATLLPEVFREFQTDIDGALDLLCQQANLPSGSWRDTEHARIMKFTVQTFREH